MSEHVRDHRSLLAAAEKRLLIAIAQRLPLWIHSDHLTALAMAAMVAAGGGYVLARWDTRALWLVVFALAVNWFGDSLDGTLARVRKVERPKYGFYLDHVLDIVSRQKSLNFPSGSQWSYSNTGYNLAVVIVSRVSGKSFAQFSQERIFGPLGMTKTSWRDDYAQIVKGRAIAYSGTLNAFRMSMPFENVHGNGGLLTTVGDLLKWNENFVTPKVGDSEFLMLFLVLITLPFAAERPVDAAADRA